MAWRRVRSGVFRQSPAQACCRTAGPGRGLGGWGGEEGGSRWLLGPHRVGRALDEGLDLFHVFHAQLAREVGHAARHGRALEDELVQRSEEHTSELQSRLHLVCRLLLEKKKT